MFFSLTIRRTVFLATTFALLREERQFRVVPLQEGSLYCLFSKDLWHNGFKGNLSQGYGQFFLKTLPSSARAVVTFGVWIMRYRHQTGIGGELVADVKKRHRKRGVDRSETLRRLFAALETGSHCRRRRIAYDVNISGQWSMEHDLRCLLPSNSCTNRSKCALSYLGGGCLIGVSPMWQTARDGMRRYLEDLISQKL